VTEPSRPAAASRLVRVFVSSTFRDMQAERDHLVKVVFPELRRRCRECAVEFVEVDLRWGVTEEQAERGETLPICLAEIERCRPYFIALLGECYGYVPEHIDPELVKVQPWLAEHRSRSITALEILHGALNQPEMATRVRFYFRDPGYLERIPPEQRANFAPESPAAHARLEALKEQVRRSGLALKEGYPGPEAVGQWILEDLWQAVDQQYPPGPVPDPLEREAAEHEAFAQSRERVYLGRGEDFDRLEAHVEGDDPPLVLLGESGVGKSALIANWARRYRQAHPDAFLFLHFTGSTPASADYAALLGRLLGELKRRSGLTEEIPATPEKLREALPLWLAGPAAKGRLVLVLDALNQLEDRDHAPDLGWLPGYFPPNVRVIVSTLPGRALAALERRAWPTFEVRGLAPPERRQVIVDYLAQYRKGLSAARLERIAAAPQAANPLYLRTLLEELRVFGVHEALDARIAHYLTAATVPDLYDLVLERLEQDYERDRPGLVRDALSFVWAARRGLYESELLELLGSPQSPLPRALWSPLYLALQESLVSRSGLLGFFHDYLREAVRRRYLPSPEAQQAWHLRLADYFGARALDERQVDELPWQLKEAEAWARLEDCITDLDRFLVLIGEARRYELMGYWQALGARYDMVVAYQAALQRCERSAPPQETLARRLNEVAFFLHLNARHEAAEPLYRRALALHEKVLGPEHPDTAQSHVNPYRQQGEHERRSSVPTSARDPRGGRPDGRHCQSRAPRLPGALPQRSGLPHRDARRQLGRRGGALPARPRPVQPDGPEPGRRQRRAEPPDRAPVRRQAYGRGPRARADRHPRAGGRRQGSERTCAVEGAVGGSSVGGPSAAVRRRACEEIPCPSWEGIGARGSLGSPAPAPGVSAQGTFRGVASSPRRSVRGKPRRRGRC
jgi:hypothetical protein